MTFFSSFLLFTGAINLFRAVVYFINQKYVTEVKIAKEKQGNADILEVAYAFTSTIRTLMLFRTCVIAWAYFFLHDSVAQDSLCYLLTGFDVYILYSYFGKQTTSGKVLRHQRILVPFVLQLSLVLAGVGCAALRYILVSE